MTTAVAGARRSRGVFVLALLVFGLLSAIVAIRRSPEVPAPAPADPPVPVPSSSPVSSPPPAPVAAMPVSPSRAVQAAPAPQEIVLSIEEIFETRETTSREWQAERAQMRMRELFEKENVAGAVRDITCRQTVCRLELEWSEEITEPYNQALVHITHEFTNEMSILPKFDGAPRTPVTVYVRYKP